MDHSLSESIYYSLAKFTLPSARLDTETIEVQVIKCVHREDAEEQKEERVKNIYGEINMGTSNMNDPTTCSRGHDVRIFSSVQENMEGVEEVKTDLLFCSNRLSCNVLPGDLKF